MVRQQGSVVDYRLNTENRGVIIDRWIGVIMCISGVITVLNVVARIFG